MGKTSTGIRFVAVVRLWWAWRPATWRYRRVRHIFGETKYGVTSYQEAAVFSPEMKKGSVELMVLALLDDRPTHGYELGKLIEARSGGEIQFNVTTLYPVLYRMENDGWISGRWVEEPGERRRRHYRLTRKGRRVLAEQRREWAAYTAAVNLVIGGSHA